MSVRGHEAGKVPFGQALIDCQGTLQAESTLSRKLHAHP